MPKSGSVIAIDGPSASGKSTVSKIVARRLNFIHVDSGALYRAVTWYFAGHRINLSGGNLVVLALNKMKIDFMVRNNVIKFSIDGFEPDAELRSGAVNKSVSQVAARPEVREWVVNRLRKMPDFGNLVMEGRDIGTVVFPRAAFKFYLDAAPEERARRRFLEMAGAITYDEVLRSILKRDGIDSARAMAPLKIAIGAIVIQSTKMSAGQVVDFIVNIVKPVLHKG